MRVLHLTDTHLGHVQRVTGSPRGWVRHCDHVAAMQRALDVARSGDVDAVLHTGDLFNRSRPPQKIIAEAAEILCDLARQLPVVVIPGNHDRRGLRRYIPHAIPGLHVVDAPAAIDVGSVRIGCIPYRRRATDWATAAKKLGKVDLIATHQAFHGVRIPPGFTFRAGVQDDTIGEQHIPPAARWIACGHIHPRQVVRVGDAQVVHPGSTERTAFSERDQTKGYAIWTFDRTISWRFVDLHSRPMALIRWIEDLGRAQPGTLIRLGPEVQHLRDAVIDRGGYLCEYGNRVGSGRRQRPASPLFSQPSGNEVPSVRS